MALSTKTVYGEQDITMNVRKGDASRRIENSGRQFWKRLRSTRDCNARRKRRRKKNA
jgi:hypothetical protein